MGEINSCYVKERGFKRKGKKNQQSHIKSLKPTDINILPYMYIRINSRFILFSIRCYFRISPIYQNQSWRMFVNSVYIFIFFFKCSGPSRLIELTIGVIEDHYTQVLSGLYEVCFFSYAKVMFNYLSFKIMWIHIFPSQLFLICSGLHTYIVFMFNGKMVDTLKFLIITFLCKIPQYEF